MKAETCVWASSVRASLSLFKLWSLGLELFRPQCRLHFYIRIKSENSFFFNLLFPYYMARKVKTCMETYPGSVNSGLFKSRSPRYSRAKIGGMSNFSIAINNEKSSQKLKQHFWNKGSLFIFKKGMCMEILFKQDVLL